MCVLDRRRRGTLLEPVALVASGAGPGDGKLRRDVPSDAPELRATIPAQAEEAIVEIVALLRAVVRCKRSRDRRRSPEHQHTADEQGRNTGNYRPVAHPPRERCDPHPGFERGDNAGGTGREEREAHSDRRQRLSVLRRRRERMAALFRQRARSSRDQDGARRPGCDDPDRQRQLQAPRIEHERDEEARGQGQPSAAAEREIAGQPQRDRGRCGGKPDQQVLSSGDQAEREEQPEGGQETERVPVTHGLREPVAGDLIEDSELLGKQPRGECVQAHDRDAGPQPDQHPSGRAAPEHEGQRQRRGQVRQRALHLRHRFARRSPGRGGESPDGEEPEQGGHRKHAKADVLSWTNEERRDREREKHERQRPPGGREVPAVGEAQGRRSRSRRPCQAGPRRPARQLTARRPAPARGRGSTGGPRSSPSPSPQGTSFSRLFECAPHSRGVASPAA